MTQPIVTKELIEYLEKLYPEYIPDTRDSLPQVFFKAGRRDVARHFRELYTKQQMEVN